MTTFRPAGRGDLAADVPLLPAQSAVAYVLRPEIWPEFRAWLITSTGVRTPESADRHDMQAAFRALIAACRGPA